MSKPGREDLGKSRVRETPRWLLVGLMPLILALPASAQTPSGAAAALSPQTRECLDCHGDFHPGIVADWQSSRHAGTTPAAALELPPLERRISNPEVPAALRQVAVGCYECHSLNPERHADNFEHFGFRINIVVSPADCRTCHAEEADQYAGSKKAHAVANLAENPLFHQLSETTLANQEVREGKLHARPATDATRNQTCYSCHGARIEVQGEREVEVDGEVVSLPQLSNWPNQGVGRINPDGSKGACTACHPRHSFSIAIARQPYTCGQCHHEPDSPAFEVYEESKHGNIFSTQQAEWNWSAVPWRVGRDFRAPTCAACHNALLATPEGKPIALRTHDFGARMWVRIFGLPYAHPQPAAGQTHLLKNADGQPLPTTLAGVPAAEGLIDPSEQARRQRGMARVCQSCHGALWVQGHFSRLDNAVVQTNQMTLAATQLMQGAWDRQLADPANLFDEPLERQWVEVWLFHATSARYGAAMGGAGHATFKLGWWDMNATVGEMEHVIHQESGKAGK